MTLNYCIGLCKITKMAPKCDELTSVGHFVMGTSWKRHGKRGKYNAKDTVKLFFLNEVRKKIRILETL